MARNSKIRDGREGVWGKESTDIEGIWQVCYYGKYYAQSYNKETETV